MKEREKELWYTEEELREATEYTEEIPKGITPPKLVAGQCDADCRPPATRQGQIWCVRVPACRNAGTGCDCVLFRLPKSWDPEDGDPPWERLPREKHPYDPANYFYRCWCVA